MNYLPNFWAWSLAAAGGGSAFPPAGSVAALDFAGGRYASSAGSLTLTQAITCVRNDPQLSYAQYRSSLYGAYAGNVARVTDQGVLREGASANRLPWSIALSNLVWGTSNMTVAGSTDSPLVVPLPSLSVVEVPTGTNSFVVPAGVTSLDAYAIGPGGNGANGTTNTNGGGAGGAGAYASTLSIVVTPGSTITVAVPAAGSELPTTLFDSGGTLRVSARHGTNAVGSTGGTGGTSALSTGSTRTSGGDGGGGSIGTGSRGGGGGGGGGSNSGGSSGRTGAAGNAFGGGGGGSLGGGSSTAPANASSGLGGAGGVAPDGTAGGVGGTSSVAAGAGNNGAGSGGGSSGTGVNGATTLSTSTVTFSNPTGGPPTTVNMAGGGGGGGGLAGNGGAALFGAGGGGGGSTTIAAGTGAAGGPGRLLIVYGGANSWTLTAGGANATISQAAGSATDASPRTASVVLKPVTVTGAISLSQDGGLTWTDVSSQLRTGLWTQVYGPSQSVANPVWMLRISNSGDILRAWLPQIENNAFCTSPIPTTNSILGRSQDLLSLNVGNFPTFINSDTLTMLGVMSPGGVNVNDGPVAGQTWSWVQVAGGYDTVTVNFTASISDGTGLAPGLVMAVSAIANGTLHPLQIENGPGVFQDTKILSQSSGPTGGIGTYNVNLPSLVTAVAMTAVDVYSYSGDAAVKPVGLDRQVGCTVQNTAADRNYGFDPQVQEYNTRLPGVEVWNRVGIAVTASTGTGTIALNGDPEDATPTPNWLDPANFDIVTLGGESPYGGPALNGFLAEVTFFTTSWSSAQLVAWTALPYP